MHRPKLPRLGDHFQVSYRQTYRQLLQQRHQVILSHPLGLELPGHLDHLDHLGMVAGCKLLVGGIGCLEPMDPYKHWGLGHMGTLDPEVGIENRIAEVGEKSTVVAGHVGSLRFLEDRMMPEHHRMLAVVEESMVLSLDKAMVRHKEVAAGHHIEAGRTEVVVGGTQTGCTVQLEDIGCFPKVQT